MDVMEAQELFCQLLQIPSVTGTDGEGKIIDFLELELAKLPVSIDRLGRTPGRQNLAACLKAQNPTQPPLILLSHVDVVPAAKEDWSFPPFSGKVKNGRIRGRGALDTKHLTAMEFVALVNLIEVKNRCRDVWFVAVIDEEKGSQYGADFLTGAMPELLSKGAVVISEGGGFPVLVKGKPFLTLTVGEKTVAKVRLFATGQGGHPGAPPKDQAVLTLAAGLEALLGEMENWNPVKATVAEEMRTILGITSPDEIDDLAARDIYLYASGNSANVRGLCLGERINTVAAKAQVVVEMKFLPGVTAEMLEELLSQTLSPFGVQWEIQGFEPGFVSSEEQRQDFVHQAARFAKEEGFAAPLLPMLALGRTDGRFFGPIGQEVYGFSPVLMADNFGETLKKVHGIDESIGADSFAFGCQVLQKITHWMVSEKE